MVELGLYTLPFVKVRTYCPSINEDIKKLWRIPQVSYHCERDQPKQAELGWAFQPEALEVFTVFIWQSWGWTFTAPHFVTATESHNWKNRQSGPIQGLHQNKGEKKVKLGKSTLP